jgi:hypothetical protein
MLHEAHFDRLVIDFAAWPIASSVILVGARLERRQDKPAHGTPSLLNAMSPLPATVVLIK